MWRMGVPVATPVGFRDIGAAAAAFVLGATYREETYRSAFEDAVRDLLSARFVRSTNSGRAALFVTLQAMKELSWRDEVVVPAFVCPSVGRAVAKAGLKPILCDVGSGGSGLDIDFLESVVTRRTLAVVVAHLHGYPCDIGPVIELAHSVGAMVIEDAAQAFGAKLRGHQVGTFADAGVFSFGMSKVLWSIGGGLIATTNAELGRNIDRVLATSPQVSRSREAIGIAKCCVVSLLVRSHHLGPLAAVWSSAMRGKHDSDDFEATFCPASHAAVARRLLIRLDQITRIRKRNASYLADCLSGRADLMLPAIPAQSEPVFLRFPIVVDNVAVKRELLKGLGRVGVNVSEMYTRASYEDMRNFTAQHVPCPRAEYLAERMLNLPTHAYMRQCELHDVVAVFDSVLGGQQAVPSAVFSGKAELSADAN